MNATTLASKPHTCRKGKKKADGCVGVRSEVESTEVGVKTSGLSVEPHLNRVTIGPSGTISAQSHHPYVRPSPDGSF